MISSVLPPGQRLSTRIHTRARDGAHPASSTWTVRYELKLRDDDVIVFHKQQGFKDIGHGSAMRWNGDQGIKVRVIGNWRLSLEYDIRYNSEPVPGKRTTDTNLIIGISYELNP